MLTIVTNTLLGINIIAVIYMAVHIVGMVGSINDLYRQLGRHQKDVNELLKANNPQAYYNYKVKNENMIRREMGIPLVPEEDPDWSDAHRYTESSDRLNKKEKK